MLQITFEQEEALVSKTETLFDHKSKIAAQHDSQLDQLLSQLANNSNWGERQRAARKLGYLGRSEAVAALLTALPDDSFWMVRCAIIQALEKIGDARAIPTLGRVAEEDAFLTVRCHAKKAIATLEASSNAQ